MAERGRQDKEWGVANIERKADKLELVTEYMTEKYGSGTHRTVACRSLKGLTDNQENHLN